MLEQILEGTQTTGLLVLALLAWTVVRDVLRLVWWIIRK